MNNDRRSSKDKIQVKPLNADRFVDTSAGSQPSQQILIAMKVAATIINPLIYLSFVVIYFGCYYSVIPWVVMLSLILMSCTFQNYHIFISSSTTRTESLSRSGSKARNGLILKDDIFSTARTQPPAITSLPWTMDSLIIFRIILQVKIFIFFIKY